MIVPVENRTDRRLVVVLSLLLLVVAVAVAGIGVIVLVLASTSVAATSFFWVAAEDQKISLRFCHHRSLPSHTKTQSSVLDHHDVSMPSARRCHPVPPFVQPTLIVPVSD